VSGRAGRDLPATFAVTVIVEFENFTAAGEERCAAMLRALAAQGARLAREAGSGDPFLSRLRPPLELIAVFDPRSVGEPVVRDLLHRHLAPAAHAVAARVEPLPGGAYYEQKNHGARLAAGDLLVFLDSDVIPDDGWLEQLIRSFAHPGLRVVGGDAYVAPRDLFTRTVALAWLFPPRAGAGLSRDRWFLANNVAFLRFLFLEHPFPVLPPGVCRGSCVELARTLVRIGAPPYRNSLARVEHAPPAGLRHYLVRGVAEGRDALLEMRRSLGPRRASLRRSVGRASRKWKRAAGTIVAERRRVGLPLLQIPLAAALAGAYYACYLLGDLGVRTFPRAFERRFQH
jgi:hypothetical protein